MGPWPVVYGLLYLRPWGGCGLGKPCGLRLVVAPGTTAPYFSCSPESTIRYCRKRKIYSQNHLDRQKAPNARQLLSLIHFLGTLNAKLGPYTGTVLHCSGLCAREKDVKAPGCPFPDPYWAGLQINPFGPKFQSHQTFFCAGNYLRFKVNSVSHQRSTVMMATTSGVSKGCWSLPGCFGQAPGANSIIFERGLLILSFGA